MHVQDPCDSNIIGLYHNISAPSILLFLIFAFQKVGINDMSSDHVLSNNKE